MPDSTSPEYIAHISCEIFLESFPDSETKCAETEDYVAYFCGLDCYDVWVKQQSQGTDSKSHK